jgi:hypothetical protein
MEKEAEGEKALGRRYFAPYGTFQFGLGRYSEQRLGSGSVLAPES